MRGLPLSTSTRTTLAFDLTQGEKTFTATSTIRFGAAVGSTFLDVQPEELVRVTLNGLPVDVARLTDGRLPLDRLEPHNELVAEARMAYASRRRTGCE